MPAAPIPDSEPLRLHTLHALDVLDTSPEPVFDALVQAASAVCETPISLVSLVDTERQWFKAALGLGDTRQTPRDAAFCAHAILGEQLLEVPDAQADPRFADSPLVRGDPHIRFYAGAPLVMPNGQRVGSLCVIDRQPRQLNEQQRAVLSQLALAASHALQTRQAQREVLALHAEVLRLSAVARHTASAVIVTDTTRRIVWVNAAFERISGLTLAEMRGQSPRDIVRTDPISQAAVDRIRAALELGQPTQAELLVHTRTGQSLWFDCEVQPLHDEQGRPTGVMALGQDISARKRAEQALADERARIARLLNSTRAGTWEDHLRTGERLLDERYVAMLGYSAADIATVASRPFVEQVHPDDLPAVTAAQRQLLDNTSDGYEIEFRMRHRDGHWVWVLSRGRVQARDAQGQPTVLGGIHLDIHLRKEAEAGLAVKRALLDTLVESTQLGTWRWQVDSGKLELNEQALRMLGHASMEAAPATMADWCEWMEPGDRTHATQALESHLNEDTPLYESETRMRHREGHWVWVLIRGRVVSRSPDGRPTWVVGSLQDVTQLKQQALDHKAQLSRVRLAAEVAHIGVWEINLHSGDLHWDEEMCRLHGVGADMPRDPDSLRRVWRQRIHPDDLPHALRELVHALHTGSSYFSAFRLCLDDGSVRHVRNAARVIGDKRSGDQRLVGITQDVTEAHALSDALARRNAEMRTILAHLPCGLSVFDAQDTLTHHNPIFLTQHSLPPDLTQQPDLRLPALVNLAVQGGEWGDLSPTEVLVQMRQLLQAMRADQRPRTQVRQRGNGQWLDVHFAPLPDGGFVSTHTDITELMKARHAALEASRSKSQFLANMSHEIRTPMNAMLGMLTLLEKTGLDDTQADYLGKAKSASRTLLGLINDILDYSKIEAGKMVLDPHPFSTEDLFNDLGLILSMTVSGKPVELLYDIDPILPPRLLGDAMRLQQVLVNLGSNAIKFTPQGEVVISVSVQGQGSEGVRLRFSVTDTGIGIAPEQQAQIFSGFTQAEASTTRRFGGTGLGLSISQHLVRAMGGELRVDSAPGRGSRFFFDICLPTAAEAGPAAAAAATSTTTTATAKPATAESTKRQRVLVVEDHPVTRQLLLRMLQTSALDAEAVPDATQALARLHDSQQPPIQAVVVDWQLPDLDGWNLVRTLRQRWTHEALRIVMLTAHGHEALHLHSRQDLDLLDGFLSKPVTPKALQHVVLQLEGGRPGLPRTSDGPHTLRLPGMRVLLAEDNPTNQQIAQELLQAEGALVLLADHGQAALDAFGTPPDPQRFDVVLMDMQMPVMDGLSASRRLRELMGSKRPPVVAMTANAMSSDRDACLDAGMVEHVGKPFDLDHLVGVLRRVVWPDGAPPAPASAVPATRTATQTSTPTSTSTPTPAAGTAPTAPTAQLPSLPQLPALDMPGALGRLGGHRLMYARMLAGFLKELPIWHTRLVDAASHPTRWRETLHTLKGVAATLGLDALAAATRELEAAPAAGTVSPEALAHLDAALQAAERDLQIGLRHLPPPGPAAAPASPSAHANHALSPAVRPMLQAIRAAALANDLQALDLVDELQAQHAAEFGADLDSLMQAMDLLDFGAAIAWCDRWLATPETLHTTAP